MSDQDIRTLTQQWVEGWNVGANEFSGEAFRPLFAPGPGGILVFDNVQGDVIVLTSVDQYVETWTPFMEPMTVWSVRLDELDVQQSGDLAVTTFKLVGTDTRGPDGSPVPFGQYGTHTWRKLPELGWRIVHEHLTTYDIDREQG